VRAGDSGSGANGTRGKIELSAAPVGLRVETHAAVAATNQGHELMPLVEISLVSNRQTQRRKS
jgi:hypothetical protein